MDSEKREKLLDLYSQDPRALPSKEIKPLKFSKIDRFANNIEINLAVAGNTQLKALEAFDQADPDIGYWHIKNSSEFIPNAQYCSNVQHQQEIGSNEFIPNSKEDMEIIRKNYFILKAVHIPGKINVTTDRLSRLEMSGDYQLKEEIFQKIQRMWRCYPKVDLFASKKNRLTKTYTSVIPRGT
jgi:hypothetical protein